MGKKKWIDKKNATTFTLVHRPQNDPLIHDETVSSMVLKPVGPGNESKNKGPQDKIKTVHDLEEELGDLVTSKIRKNEGEAANYGIHFDDTEYDYMQHLRDLGGSTEAVFIEAPQAASKQRKSKPQKLEDALREAPKPEDLLPKDILPNSETIKRTYQDQQDIPDALAGFQPDMDPRLREVLEALEDEAYVDDDEDVFGQLTKDAEELDENEFYEQQDEFDVYGDGREGAEDDNDGWATDDTEKPSKSRSDKPSKPAAPKLVSFSSTSSSVAPTDPDSAPPEASEDWMSEFSKFKKAQKSSKNKAPDSEIASSIGDMSSIGGLSSIYSLGGSKSRRRRKKAAVGSVYSMSSSVLTRTEGQTLLDDRFEKIEALYEDSDEDEEENEDAIPKSRPPPPEGFKESRQDFNAIMDDFLENYSVGGKYGQRVKRGKQQTGMEQLDEIRRGLGRPKIRGR